jgi:hypothetical protein
MYSIKNFIVDVYGNTSYDIYVFGEYVSEDKYNIHIHRLDTRNNEGWNENLKVFVFSPIYSYYEIIEIGSSTVCKMAKSVKMKDIKLEPDITKEIRRYRQYNTYHKSEPCYEKVDVNRFNEIFSSEMVILPQKFYAIGIKNEKTYIYSEGYNLYFEIAPTMQFIINLIRYYEIKNLYDSYFVICACDGFPDNTSYCIRTDPILILDKHKYIGKDNLNFDSICSNELEIIHKKIWLLCQNNHKDYKYTLALPDHHYFVLKEYREFRYLHNGIFFDEKIPKMIYASTKERSSKYNFKEYYSEITQRELFYNLFENNENFVTVKSGWMKPNFLNREEQIKYKYILDMDGLASTWDSLAWKLRSGSVLFRVNGVWNQWFFDKFKEWIHYVPIKEDFSDLMEKFEWCEKNPDKCKEIIYNACDFFETYRLYNAEEYVINNVLSIL